MRLVFSFFLILLAFCPLAFGCVEHWSLAVMELSCFALGLYVFLSRNGGEGVVRVPGLLPLLLFALFLLVQALPLPAALVRILSPECYALHGDPSGGQTMPAWISLSLQPGTTLEEFFRFSAYVIFYALAVQLGSDHTRLRKTLWMMVGVGVAVALLGIVQKSVGNGRMYWLRPIPDNATWMGPYLYHNHFAGLLEMLAPLALVLSVVLRPKIRYARTLRQRLASFWAAPATGFALLLGVATLLMIFAVVVSLSRGGMLAMGLSLLVLVAVLLWRGRLGGAGVGPLLLLLLVLLVSGFGWQQVDQRFGKMFDPAGELSDGRLQIWADALRISADFPLVGTGWGTFGNIFPSYDSVVRSGHFIYHAHNDYLETLVEGGLVGLLLIGWGLAAIMTAIIQGLRQRHDQQAKMLCWGALTGVGAIFLHSWTDFNFKNGANGLFFFLLLAVAVVAAHNRRRGRSRTYLSAITPPGAVPVLVTVSLMLFCAGLWQYGGHWMAWREVAGLQPYGWEQNAGKEQVTAWVTRLEKAERLTPFSSTLPFTRARLLTALGDGKGAGAAYQRARRLNPAQASYLEDEADWRATLGTPASWRRAEGLYRMAIRRDRANPERLWSYGEFLLDRREKEKALALFGRLLALDNAAGPELFQTLASAGIADAAIRRIVPEETRPLLDFGVFLAHKQNDTLAAAVYRQALEVMRDDAAARAWHFQRVAGFLNRRGERDEALNALLAGITRLPGATVLRLEAGRLYQRLGLNNRAAEQYRQVLTQEPGNAKARRRLDGLLESDRKRIL